MSDSKRAPVKKVYHIAQRVDQTDWYEIEASSPEEALRIYRAAPGLAQCLGTVGGWIGQDDESIVVQEAGYSPSDD